MTEDEDKTIMLLNANGFLQREIDRIRAAMRENRDNPVYQRLYDAMNALEWAKDPYNIMPPYKAITGNEEDPEGYSAPRHPLGS